MNSTNEQMTAQIMKMIDNRETEAARLCEEAARVCGVATVAQAGPSAPRAMPNPASSARGMEDRPVHQNIDDELDDLSEEQADMN
jgi:hypothetical protein